MKPLLAVLVAVACACADTPAIAVSAPIGEPLPGLNPDQAVRFQAGAIQFARIFTPEDGLGPRFNENACNACHTDPANGGTGEQLVVKASTTTVGVCDPLEGEGGPNLRRRVTPLAAAAGATAAPIPGASTHTGRFNTPFLFGLGMIDAIDLATLEERADPEDLDGDGISGRVGTDASGRPARFGRKANVATLAAFVDEAFRIEMGVTTPGHSDESRAGAVPGVPEGSDPVPDPEIDRSILDATIDFVRFLAPPDVVVGGTEEGRGSELFDELGCSACHVPALTTGAHEVAALSRKAVGLYSDLLLHDMGAELASACTSGAEPAEYRTEMLMGLRYRRTFLHDGRAVRVRDAILMHGGEAAGARARFAALDLVTQEALLAFLGTL